MKLKKWTRSKFSTLPCYHPLLSDLIVFGRLKSVNLLLTDVPKIYESLERVRDENGRHSQYATAIENLKHIFTVQASVTKTQQWIEEDKLLHAHQVRSNHSGCILSH